MCVCVGVYVCVCVCVGGGGWGTHPPTDAADIILLQLTRQSHFFDHL